MSEKPTYKILVIKDGPYMVSGSVPLAVQVIGTNAEGGSWVWEEGPTLKAQDTCALCRCGHSGNAPYCDGSHARISFEGTEAAAHLPYAAQKETFAGPSLTLEDARPFCSDARFCDAVQASWDLVAQTNDPKARELLLHQVSRCPSGRLVVRDNASGEMLEPALEPSIGIVQDAAEKCSGPLWIRGGILVELQDGTSYEIRNRMTLCRCGQSKNKPFCDGSHIEARYKDGMP